MTPLELARRWNLRPGVVTLVVLFLTLSGIAAFWAEPAQSVTGTTGPATVAVTPDGPLRDGQAVQVHAQANTGDLFEIRAHICSTATPIKNTFNFGPDGGLCSPNPVSGGSDAETIVVVPAGSGAKGDLAFRVGTGTGTPWTDYFGKSRTLTCGPQNACALVVQLQVTDKTVFYSVPICYSGACTPAPGEQPAPSNPLASSGGAAAGGAAGAGATGAGVPAGATATTKAPTKKSAASGKTATSGAGTATTVPASNGAAAPSGTGSVSGVATPADTGNPKSAQSAGTGSNDNTSGLEAAWTTVAGRVTAHEALRVFAAGLAGVLGGILLALIGSKARRQMMGLEA